MHSANYHTNAHARYRKTKHKGRSVVQENRNGTLNPEAKILLNSEFHNKKPTPNILQQDA